MAVDVRKAGAVLGQHTLAPVRRPVQRGKQGVQHGAQVRAVLSAVEVDQVGKQVLGLEDTGVVGQQAEQQPDQKNSRAVAVEAVLLERVV